MDLNEMKFVKKELKDVWLVYGYGVGVLLDDVKYTIFGSIKRNTYKEDFLFVKQWNLINLSRETLKKIVKEMDRMVKENV